LGEVSVSRGSFAVDLTDPPLGEWNQAVARGPRPPGLCIDPAGGFDSDYRRMAEVVAGFRQAVLDLAR
jgi:hypothetical protein